MKKIFILCVTCMLFIVSANTGLGESDAMCYEQEAKQLFELGLFKGGSNGFELDRAASRIEGLIMLIRLRGKESDALSVGGKHPFTDVPSWADAYVGYAYTHGMTNGISATLFGSSQKISLTEYLTLLLRVLQYDDHQGDFSWNESIDLAYLIGLINDNDCDRYNNPDYVFLRNDCAHLAFKTLYMNLKGKNQNLRESLIQSGIIKDKNTINLAFLGNLSGEYAYIGEELLNGSILAIEEANSNGGILGEKIILHIEDSFELFESIRMYNILTSLEGVDAVIGPMTSFDAETYGEMSDSGKTVFVSPTANNKVLTENHDYMFRTCLSFFEEGENLGRLAKLLQSDINAYGIYDENAYGQSYVEFWEGIKSVIQVKNIDYGQYLGYENMNVENQDMERIAQIVKDMNPNILIVSEGSSVELYNRVQQIRKAGYNGIILSESASWYKDDTRLLELENVYCCASYPDATDNQGIQNFDNTYFEKFNKWPGQYGYFGYEATKTLINGISTAGTTIPSDVKTALLNGVFDGLAGKIKFNANGVAERPVFIYRIHNYKWEYVGIL